MKLRDRERDQTYHFVVGKRPEVLCKMKKKRKMESIAEGENERSLLLGRQEGE